MFLSSNNRQSFKCLRDKQCTVFKSRSTSPMGKIKLKNLIYCICVYMCVYIDIYTSEHLRDFRLSADQWSIFRPARDRSVPRETDLGKMRRDGTRRETGAVDCGLEERAHLGGLFLSLSFSLSFFISLQHLQPSLSLASLSPYRSLFSSSGPHVVSISFSPSSG